MEEFLLDILGWERSEADWLFKLFHKFGAIGDSFCVMCDSAGMDAYECVYSDRVEPEALETVFLQNLFASNLDNTDFILPNNITCVKDVILKQIMANLQKKYMMMIIVHYHMKILLKPISLF